jgi:hypothetical protein
MTDFARELYSAFFPKSKRPQICVVGQLPPFGEREPIDEEGWIADPLKFQTCDHLERMLDLLRRTETARKLRLFACACCRQIWPLFEDERSRAAVIAAERFADCEIDQTDLSCASLRAFSVHEETRSMRSHFGPIAGIYAAGMQLEWGDEPTDQSSAFRAAVTVARLSANCPAHKREQIRLLRHIVGNPWRPHFRPPIWSAAVCSLALSLYQESDCHFALHDALLEAGQSELAQHFTEPFHPKGCWAIDLILGKQ